MLSIFTFTITPLVVSAQGTQTGSQKTPCVSSGEEYCLLEPIVINNTAQEKVKIADYVKTMFKIGIGLAALFAVFMIIFGGFQYMTSESIGGKGDGKEKIEGALWGLALALGSFLILNTINPQLLEFSGGLEPVVVKRDLAERVQYKDKALEEFLRISDEARANNTSIEALRKRAQSLRDQAFEKGDSEEGRHLTEQADKVEREADKLYNTSVVKLNYDNAVQSIMRGETDQYKNNSSMLDSFDRQVKLLTEAGATPKEIATVRAQRQRLIRQLEQAAEMYKLQRTLAGDFDTPDPNKTTNRNIPKSTLDIDGALKVRTALIKKSKEVISELTLIDPEEAKIFKEFTAKNDRLINPMITYRRNCPNDFVTERSGAAVGGQIINGALSGMILGLTVGTVPGALAGGAIGAVTFGATELIMGRTVPCQAK